MSRAFRLGVFIIGTLAILAIGVFVIGDKEFLFSRTYRLQADFPNVGGMNNGADVRVGGIHQGTVTVINLPTRPDGKVTVEMKMHANTQDIIKKDSVASIKTEGLLGNKYVEISFGSKNAPGVHDGDTIPSDTAPDTATVARATMASAQEGIESFNENMEALKHNFFLRGFFKDRGYEDSGELTKHSISRIPAGPRIKEFSYEARKVFEKPDTAKFRNEDVLKVAGKFLEANPFRLTVIAANETMGDSDEARVLTQARAMVVRDYLVENFKLDDTKVRTIGLGKNSKADSSQIQILVYR